MQKPNIKTSKPIVPMIYAYTTPGVCYHDGYIKIGYTEQNVDERIRQQTHTAGIKAQKEWTGTAVKDKPYVISYDSYKQDEAHEGVDTLKTDVAFDRINRKFTLHLSGTPFKVLANDKFNSDAIFNYTYADEQRAKRDWDETSEQENPYANLPKLNLYTYQMSEIVRDELAQGMEVDDEQVAYAFDLNEFFRVENGRFVHNTSVDKFLDAMTCQTKFP
ncbi:MAG: GIY-YIG nuclease family protein, partial [Selenomonas sp.]|nr:GIY-YIG nuclease family protein [Selenomonas sp.]